MNAQNPPGDELSLLDSEAHRIAALIAGFLRGTLTPGELDELDRWVAASDRNMLLFEELTDERNLTGPLGRADGQEGSLPAYRSDRVPKRRSAVLRRLRLPAAAVVLLLLGAGWWWSRSGEAPPLAGPSAALSISHPPADSTHVTLTFNGRTLALPPYRDTAWILGGTTRVQAGPQGLSYRGGGAAAPRGQELHTPPGRTYRLELGDGTRVWLNAGSRLYYPSAFTGGQRAVRLEGEGYFEVAPDAARPFLVHSRGLVLRVLGTAFNVEAYDSTLSATLVEGRLKVSGPRESALLSPGEQLNASAAGPFEKTTHADVGAVLGWQNGLFVFRDASISSVLTQLGHWYGVTTTLQGSLPYHITATLPRSLPLRRVLDVLEETGRVRFELEGRSLKAMPAHRIRP